MPNRVIAAQECDATGDEKNYYSWGTKNISVEVI